MSVNGNGVVNYIPLKQILSDSKSEDDRKLVIEMNIKGTESCNDLDSSFQSSKKNILDDKEDFKTNINTVKIIVDDVSFLQPYMSNKSFSLRCAFVTFAVCICTVALFMCDIPSYTCCNRDRRDKTTSWELDLELPYNNVEFSGAIQVVDDVFSKIKNIIFLYRGNHMMKDSKNDNVNGVLLIAGYSGKVGWYTRETRIPTEINCHIIDINRDKQKDCIVSGSEGLLAAINPLTGTYYWNINRHGKVFRNIAIIDFPVVIKDIDHDKVDDLLTVATIDPNTNHNSLLVISGATGNIIGEPWIIDYCLYVKLLKGSNSVNISFTCKNSTIDAVHFISYPVLFETLIVYSVHLRSSSVVSKSLKKDIHNTRVIYTNGPGKLVVENLGKCPSSCRVNLKLLVERNGTTNASWEYTANHVYAMRPSLFAFKDSIRGFVLKLLQWNTAHHVRGVQEVDEVIYNAETVKVNNDTFYYHNLFNMAPMSKFVKYTNFTVNEISEKIVLVAFDNLQIRAVNVSEMDILQICTSNLDIKLPVPICQPDLEYQEESLMFADLYGDQSLKLMSYYSTFMARNITRLLNPKTHDWPLDSTFKLIDLETELTKIFDKF